MTMVPKQHIHWFWSLGMIKNYQRAGLLAELLPAQRGWLLGIPRPTWAAWQVQMAWQGYHSKTMLLVESKLENGKPENHDKEWAKSWVFWVLDLKS